MSSSVQSKIENPKSKIALDFFAGSGLVTLGLSPHFDVVWANDNSPRKTAVYSANFPAHTLDARSIVDVRGWELPRADLAWASFPCQDLSLAGKMQGIRGGRRSSLYFEWLRVLDEMPDADRPRVLCVENVIGFLVADGGSQFKPAYEALRDRGFRAGALVVDAVHFVPQSRQRSFLVAVRSDVNVDALTAPGPSPGVSPRAVLKAHDAVSDPEWLWWELPPLPTRRVTLADCIQFDAPCDPPEHTARLLSMLSPLHEERLARLKAERGVFVGTGYKRIRVENGRRVQRLEVRFDGVAGCLRTPNGGSSRQTVVIVDNGRVRTRLLTPREAARLMGAPDSFALPEKYNDAYWAMGDAVAAPVAKWLSDHLLWPLAEASRSCAVRNSRLPASAGISFAPGSSRRGKMEPTAS